MARVFYFIDLENIDEVDDPEDELKKVLTIEYAENRLKKESDQNFELNHGDILMTSEYRATGQHFVCKPPNDDAYILYYQFDSAGHGFIPLEVTRYIENPVEFYKDVWHQCDDSVVMLDANVHPIVFEHAGNRVVDNSRKPYYDYCDEKIMIRDTKKKWGWEQGRRYLSSTTPDQFLESEDYEGSDDDEYDEYCVQANKKRKLWSDSLQIGDNVSQYVSYNGGTCGGGSRIVYISPDRQRIYTYDQYADMHPPQIPLSNFHKFDQKYLGNYFVNDETAADPNWRGRARVCCFTSNQIEGVDRWISQSSLCQIKIDRKDVDNFKTKIIDGGKIVEIH